jgi:hypothetical protein
VAADVLVCTKYKLKKDLAAGRNRLIERIIRKNAPKK